MSISVHAKEKCGCCQRRASQCMLGDEAQCVTCVLVGDDLPSATEHTNGLLTALVGPARSDSLAVARARLRNAVGADIDAYNRFARAVIKKSGVAPTTTLAAFFSRTYDANALALHAVHLSTEYAAADNAAAFADQVAHALMAPLARELGSESSARALLAGAIGPLSKQSMWDSVPRLLYLGAEQQTWATLAGTAADPRATRTDALEHLVDAVFAPPLQSAHTEPYGDWLAETHRALERPEMADFRARLVTNVGRLREKSEPSAVPDPGSPLDGNAASLLVALMGAVDYNPNDANTVTDRAATAFNSSRQEAEKRVGSWWDALFSSDADPAGPFAISSELIGAAAVEQVDASLLRRAKERVAKVVKDKAYSIDKLRTELLKLYAISMRNDWTWEQTYDWVANSAADATKRQTIVVNAAGGAQEWPNFLMVAGNEFYRSPTADPPRPAKVGMTWEQFVKKNQGEPQASVIADQLVNMAAYLNKRALQAQALPPPNIEIATPDGARRLPRTAQYAEVVSDLQTLRRLLIEELRPVGSTRYSTPTEGSTLNAPELVDRMLVQLFQRLWVETVPSPGNDSLTFETIREQYLAASGTPDERRGSIMRRLVGAVRGK